MHHSQRRIRHIYTSLQHWTQNLGTINAGPSDRQSSRRTNLIPSEKRTNLVELVKLSRNWALNYGDMQNVSVIMLVDRCHISNVWQQYQKSLEKSVELKFENGAKDCNGRKNINTEEAKERLEETPLSSRATIWITASTLDLSKSTLPRYC